MRALFVGINRAVQFFQNLIMPIKAYCQQRGITLQSYIHDLRVIGRNKEICELSSATAQHILRDADFLLKDDNASTEATQSVKFLWLVNNIESFIYQIPQDKKQSYKSHLLDILKTKTASPLQRAELNCKLCSHVARSRSCHAAPYQEAERYQSSRHAIRWLAGKPVSTIISYYSGRPKKNFGQMGETRQLSNSLRWSVLSHCSGLSWRKRHRLLHSSPFPRQSQAQRKHPFAT